MERDTHQICKIIEAAKSAMEQEIPIQYELERDIRDISVYIYEEDSGDLVNIGSISEWYEFCIKNILKDIKCLIPLEEKDWEKYELIGCPKACLMCIFENGTVRCFFPEWDYDSQEKSYDVSYWELRNAEFVTEQIEQIEKINTNNRGILEEVNLWKVQKKIPSLVRLWIEKVEGVYGCLQERLSEKRWKTLFTDELFDDEFLCEKATQAFFAFFRKHHFLKNDILKLVFKKFGMEAFYLYLPENMVESILQKMQTGVETKNAPFDGSEFPYEWFSKKGKADFDYYISLLLRLEEAIDIRDFDEAGELINILKKQELSHPYMTLYQCVYQAESDKISSDTSQNIIELMVKYSRNRKVIYKGARVLWKCKEYQKAALTYRYLEEVEVKFAEADWCISQYELQEGNYMAALQYAMEAFCQEDPKKSIDLMLDLYEVYTKECEKQFGDNEISLINKERLLEQYLMIELRMEGILERPLPIKLLKEHLEYSDFFSDLPQYRCAYNYETDEFERCIYESRIWRLLPINAEESVLALKFEGYANRFIGKTESAYIALAQAVQADKKQDCFLLLEMAKEANKVEKYKEAQEATGLILKKIPNCFAAMLVRQVGFQHEFVVHEVIGFYSKMTNIAPYCPQCYELVILNLCAYEQYEEARKILDRTKKLGIKTSKLLLLELVFLDKRTVSRMKPSEIEEREKNIIMEYTEGRFSQKELAELYYELALISSEDYIYLNNKYIDFMNKSLTLYPDVKKYLQAAKIEVKGGSREQAAKYLEKCIEASNADGWGYMFYGIICRENGEYEKCLRYLQIAGELEPDNTMILENLYNTYQYFVVELKQREYLEECIKIVYRMVEKKPQNSAYYYCTMGKLYKECCMEKEALKAYDKALEAQPEYTEGLFEKGKLLVKWKEYEKARYYMIKSLFSIPEMDKHDDLKLYPRYMEIAETYEAEGKIVAAKSWYQRGVDTLYYEKNKKICKEALKRLEANTKFHN